MSNLFRIRTEQYTLMAAIFAFFLGLAAIPAVAQQQPTPPPTATTIEASQGSASMTEAQVNVVSSRRYPIGPGDVLNIHVLNNAEFSRDGVRVNERGTITLPLLEGEIQAACRTEVELAKEITTRYLKYLRNPQVDVYIKDYQSQPVAVIGAVNAPGRFQLQRRVRLLELLTYVGGPNSYAGQDIQIIHNVEVAQCDVPRPEDPNGAAGANLITYKLKDTMRGLESANPFVQPGDIITLLQADQIYLIGGVVKPGPVPMRDTMTLSEAIMSAGGTMPDSRKERVRILRQKPGSTSREEIIVNLKAIEKQQAEDFVLQANDVVDVPGPSGAKKTLKTIFTSLVPGFATLPIRVIP
jgi:polysaccharide export outer membrane protein